VTVAGCVGEGDSSVGILQAARKSAGNKNNTLLIAYLYFP
jgi:hypothetical protein